MDEVDATPDEAFDLGWVQGYNAAMAELDERLQSVKETAWAEGWNGARIYQVPRSENPYKSERP